MKKKGFTLIELLAVIVILAIIALIATPAVLNIIEDSRKSSVIESTKRIARAAETYYIQEVLKNSTVGSIDLESDTLKYTGGKPDKGNIVFDDKGKAYITMYMQGYCVERKYNGDIKAEKTDIKDCEIFYENEVADTCYDGKVLSDYTINLNVCKDFFITEYEYSEEDAIKFCTKGELASDGWSLEIEIKYEYWNLEKLEDDGIITNVEYETKCLSCFETVLNAEYEVDVDACIDYLPKIGFPATEDEARLFCTDGEESQYGTIREAMEMSNPFEILGTETLRNEGVIRVKTSDGVSIIGYRCYDGNEWDLPTITDAVVPTRINGEYVRIINQEGLSDYDLTSIDLMGANKLETIKQGSFSYNQNLTEIKIPYSTKTIESNMCENCENLTKIEIDNYVDAIDGEPWVEDLSPEVIWLRGTLPLNKDTSGANAPVLLDNMIPVVNSGKKWFYADKNSNWYNYGEKYWANGVILKDGVTKSVGDEITDEDVALWYVWVPRYTYTLFNTPVLCSSIEGLSTTYNSNYAVCYSGTTVDTFVGTNYAYVPVEEQVIDIKFENGLSSSGTVTCTDYINQTDANGNIIEISEQCTDSKNGTLKKGISTYTHPAFSFGDRELPGIWVAKYPARLDNNKVVINQTSGSKLTGKSENEHFNLILSIDNTYGITAHNHIPSNMEWGALAYLTQSKYGLGMANVSDARVNSTTGNESGIYFVPSGQEYCIGRVEEIGGYDSRYYDLYTTASGFDGVSRSKLGDAIKETYAWAEGTTNDMNQMVYDYYHYISRINPFLYSISSYDSYLYWNTTSRSVAIPPQE